MDNCVKNLGIQKVNFLKIDAEGAEADILKGAEETLKITKHIAMELHHPGEAKEVTSFLKERGFEVHVIGGMLYAKNLKIAVT